jgi:AAA domain
MTQRERQTPDRGTVAAAPAAHRSAPLTPSTALPAASLWEDLYHRASPAQQEALVTLAAQQGVLYAHQIAPPENGVVRRSLLPALLNGQIKDLQPLRPPKRDPVDDALDDGQREAVSRALHTPDVCLIQGLPGTGKSRVIAEIIRQASIRGERVLFVAPASAAFDRVLQQVGAVDSVYAVRCLAPHEELLALPPCVRRLTVAERVRHFEEQTLPAARLAVETARQNCEKLRGQEAMWNRLEELLTVRERLAAQTANLDDQREQVAAAVEGDAATLEMIATVERRACVQQEQLDTRRADVRTALAKNAGALQEVDHELSQLTPLADACRAGWWWSVAWWRAWGKGDVGTRCDELRKRRDELQAIGDRLKLEQAELGAEHRQVEENGRAECTRVREAERDRRLAALALQRGALQQEQNRFDTDWGAACCSLSEGGPPANAAAFPSARAAWATALREAEEEFARSQQWAEGVESAREGLPERIARCANLVAATTTALAGDAHFGDKMTALPLFDLLILEDADQVTESEFVHVARRARRWVLVGEPMADAEASDALPRRAVPGRPLRPAALRPGFFQRLWQHLHPDPRRLPYAWMKRDGRLVCRLRSVPAEQQQYLESEAVADRPEIELRIVSPPRQLPLLVEVVFPSEMSIHEAKEYIFRELGEAPLQAHGAAARWIEEADRIILQMGTSLDPDAVPVALGDGIRELVGCLPPAGDMEAQRVPWHTCGLAFDRDAGWTLDRAQQWVEEQIKLRDLGRTAFLGVSHRMQPALARVLSDILSTEDALAGQPPFSLNHSARTLDDFLCLEFVAIPTLPPEPEPHHRADGEPRWQSGGTATAAPRLRSARSGAGLEVDLADPRRLDPLPADLRAELPGQGFVNYLEAQAVVRQLEMLAAEPSLLAAAASIQCPQQGVCHGAAHCPVIAVMALYAAQVELIQRLIQRSSVLAACSIAIEVGLPAAFRHRDCHVAVISLTRSHTHRAVTYGDHPRTLVQALTRARSHAIVFGDPGTLARRSQWQGPVDHLDETAAAQERHLTAQLVGYIQGHGSFPHAFQFREGSSV